MSTRTIYCDAELCRHHDGGSCTKETVTLANASFRYLSFEAVGGWQRLDADEQFCQDFAERSASDASP